MTYSRYNDLEPAYKKKSEEGLSRLLGFLREIEEREQQEEIERLRPVGIQVHRHATKSAALLIRQCLQCVTWRVLLRRASSLSTDAGLTRIRW